MARARNIKPGFFANEELADCDVLARLLFISLWTLADREGRLEFRPKKIKAQTFPYDDCDIESLIRQLECAGFIFLYVAGGETILQINNWSKHQNPHHKEVESELPRFDKSKHGLCSSQASVNHDESSVCEGYIPMSNTIRKRIYERDGYACAYCGGEDSPEIDHIIPISKGGNSVDGNLQVLCKACNSKKNNNIVNQALSMKHGYPVIESSMDQERPNESASCPTDSLLLIPDSGILNPEPPKAELVLADAFEELWSTWPKGFGDKGPKQTAWREFQKLKPDHELFASMLRALDAQGVDKQNKTLAGQFVAPFQHVERWIKNKRWTDEINELVARPGKLSKSDEADRAYAEQLARITGGDSQRSAGFEGDGIDFLPAEQH